MAFSDFLVSNLSFQSCLSGRKFLHITDLLQRIEKAKSVQDIKGLQLFLNGASKNSAEDSNPPKDLPFVVNILRTQIMYSKSMSPLHVCVRKNNIHVLNIILAMDAKLEVFEEGSSLSPIDLAVQNGHHQLVSLFMAYGGELKHRSVLPEHMLPLHGVYQILWRTEAEALYECMQSYWSTKGQEPQVEFNKGRKVQMELEQALTDMDKIIKDNPTTYKYSSQYLELRWRVEHLESSKNYRSKERLALLNRRLRQSIPSKALVKKEQVQDVLTCPVCLLVPNGQIFTCDTCANMVCKGCHDRLKMADKFKCPICREDLSWKPMKRNRLVERLLDSLKN